MTFEGKHHSEEFKKERRAYRHTDDAKRKISESKLGKPRSEDTKQKLKESNTGLQAGEKNPMYGKHHSDETKKKISEKKIKEDAGYFAIHLWVRKNKPCQTNCALCGEVKPLDLANLSGEYKRDINDFIWACRKCHKKFDKENKTHDKKQTEVLK